jgi:predicted component of type VI protein secretion system
MMEAKLIVVGGDTKTTEVDLRLPTIVGRGREAKLTLPHPLVSRQHCEIFEQNGQLMVRDLGSLNGTFIGKTRITESILFPGQLLTIGTVTFRAVYGEENGSEAMQQDAEEPTAAERHDSTQVSNAPESIAAAASNGNGHASSSASESEVIIDSGEFEVYEEVDPDDDSFIEVDEVMTLGEEEVEVEVEEVEELDVTPAAHNSDDTIEIPEPTTTDDEEAASSGGDKDDDGLADFLSGL